METILDSPASLQNTHSGYAGFWIRVLAAIIDGMILTIPNWIVLAMLGFTDMSDPTVVISNMGVFILGSTILQWLYYALLESSEKQASLGKMALGLKVTDLNGERISFGRATGRYFGKFISYFIMFIGFLMVAFTPKKQGLHDIMANTLVVRK